MGENKMMKKIDDIVKNKNEAEKLLKTVREILKRNETGDIEPLMKKIILCRLMIEDDETDDLKKLAILSIKQQDRENGKLSDSVILSKIEKYDCHQTNLVAQKKTLLIMFIEKELELCFENEDAVGINTIHDLCQIIWKYQEKQV